MFDNLNEFDYKLLDFIKKYNQISLDDILKKFPDSGYGTKYRLYLLSQTAFDEMNINSIFRAKYYNSLNKYKIYNYVKCINDMYSLTSKGYKALIDYKAEKRKNFLKYLDSFIFKFLPLIISLLSVYCSYLALST